MANTKVNLQNVVVDKPWGYEYLVYQNDSVAVWCLRIHQGQATSLHCHPHKKTGLILLSGEATLSFLNDTTNLKPLSRLILRPGLFHSTKALSPDGIVLLEFETPVGKDDLVRFEDAYGREKKPYEGQDSMRPLPADFVRFAEPEAGRSHRYQMSGLELSVEKFTSISELRKKPKDAVIGVLDGGLTGSNGEPIVGPGEVGSIGSLLRVAEAFEAPKGISLLIIERGAVAGAKTDAGKRSPDLGSIPGLAARFPRERTLALFRQICVNRYFELEAAAAYKTGMMKMPVYLSLGQEQIPASIANVSKDFLIFAQHRAHSYYLSFGGDRVKLIDELLHRQTGCAGGMGGSASIHDPKIGMFGHSGLMGDQIPIAVGAALGSGKRVLAVAGDASIEEDYAFGAMGYAATKKLPVLFLCEDNDLSILTHVATRRSWSMIDVARAIGLAALDIADDPWLIAHHTEQLLDQLPALLNVRTCRELWHAGTGCDGPPEWNRFALVKGELKKLGLESEADKIENEVKSDIRQLWQKQLRKP